MKTFEEITKELNELYAKKNTAYSIGELISLFPKNISMQREDDKWKVSIGDVSITKAELIDALFELLTH